MYLDILILLLILLLLFDFGYVIVIWLIAKLNVEIGFENFSGKSNKGLQASFSEMEWEIRDDQYA